MIYKNKELGRKVAGRKFRLLIKTVWPEIVCGMVVGAGLALIWHLQLP